MTHDEALDLLSDPDVAVRLKAARFLAAAAVKNDLPAIDSALRRELDRWVRRHLVRAERFARDKRTNRRRLISLASDSERSDELYGLAVAEVTALLLHEVNVLIGDVRRHAQRDLSRNAPLDYEVSRTKAAIDRMDRLTAAIATLNQAASPANFAEFDVAGLLIGLAESSFERSLCPIETVGPEPALIWTDGQLLELVVDQALRNAVESNRDAGAETAVRLGWSITDDGLVVSVQDAGLGLPKGFDHTFRSVRTNKDKRDHSGIGLITASRAAASIGGQISVTPRLDGGVEFLLIAPTRGRQQA